MAWSGLAEPSPDFETDIRPIFERHCFECHGNGNREGELDLETVAGVRVGGHSGSPLLAKDLEQSELYLRVTSTSPGYKMPKTGDPLSAVEIETLAAWIQTTPPTAIAEQANDVAPKTNANHQNELAEATSSHDEFPSEDSIFSGLDVLTPGQRYQAIGVSIAIALLLVYLIVRVIQTRNKKRRATGNQPQGSTSILHSWVVRVFVGTILCVALVGFGYYYLLASKLSQQVEDLAASVAKLQLKSEISKPIGPQHLPLPPSPMHPPRLGGRYYRGNDERDPSLFNGGFYRTATIDLQLVDAAGQSMQWEDKVTGELFVELTIDRAPEATRELFSDRVREAVSLQHYNLPSNINGVKSQLEVAEVEQQWRAKIALPKIDSWKDGRTAGMIYMMYGVDHAVKSSSGTASPRPHFGIRYEINLNQGKIALSSTLWMGSMYTLGGRVMVPDENRVLLDRWFDWRPIPTIEGEGSSDPELLGLPEHVR